jgi:predicted lipoprotein with Yx(FWY)xxD motif
MFSSRVIRALATGAAVAALVAACSGAASPSPSVTPTTAQSSEASAAAPSSASASGSVLTVAATTGSLGVFLTGTDGKTLYTFKNDTAGASTCTGSCATTWPPLTVASGATAVAGTGVTGAVATITRADGTTQVTYKGQPLYYYSADPRAGDTNGQGLFGKWFVAAP